MYDLGNLNQLCYALNEFNEALGPAPVEVVIGEMHCPKCNGVRRMSVRILHGSGTLGFRIAPKYGPISRRELLKEHFPHQIAPSLFEYNCTQCDTRFTALAYEGRPGESHLAIFPSVHGGLATPHTPPNVAYYLDQAQRSRAVTANSAAICMYRAALEHLLFDKGFIDGMLNKKISELESQITSGKPPSWARDLNTDYLHVMKELGNGAIHTNDGDVTKQSAFDSHLLNGVEAAFQGLLDLAYEEPLRRSQRLSSLKTAAASVKK